MTLPAFLPLPLPLLENVRYCFPYPGYQPCCHFPLKLCPLFPQATPVVSSPPSSCAHCFLSPKLCHHCFSPAPPWPLAPQATPTLNHTHPLKRHCCFLSPQLCCRCLSPAPLLPLPLKLCHRFPSSHAHRCLSPTNYATIASLPCHHFISPQPRHHSLPTSSEGAPCALLPVFGRVGGLLKVHEIPDPIEAEKLRGEGQGADCPQRGPADGYGPGLLVYIWLLEKKAGDI